MPFGLSSLAVKAIIIAIVFLAGLGVGGYFTKAVEQNKYKALELQYKEAQIKAIQEAQRKQRDLDMISINSARKEAQAQAALTAKAQRQLSEVSKHVKTGPSHCITYGFVRVLDASVHGVLADSLSLPTGKSDDTCTTLRPIDVAQSVVRNYNTAGQNSEQLNQIIKWARDVQAQQEKWRADYEQSQQRR